MLERNCRVDETYNEDFLGEKDLEFVAGMDFMRMSVCNLFEDNLDAYKEVFENVDTIINVVKFLDLCKYEITEVIRHWSENERNGLIVSMIDNMDEDEYEKNKEIAMQKNSEKINPKQYVDTMSMKYILDSINGEEKKMDKYCMNCENSHIMEHDDGTSDIYCYAQKWSPKTNAYSTCEHFKIKNSLKDTKPRYSSDEIKALQEKIEGKFDSYCNSKSSCVGCQYGGRHPYCIMKFTLDYLNKKGNLKLGVKEKENE